MRTTLSHVWSNVRNLLTTWGQLCKVTPNNEDTHFLKGKYITQGPWEDGHWRKKEKNKNYSWYSVQGPGWYRQLSLLNCDQLWQLFFRGWTILLSTVIYDIDSRITAKYSKCQSSFYSMQVSFRCHSWDALRHLHLWVSAQRFDSEPGSFRVIEPRRFPIVFP